MHARSKSRSRPADALVPSKDVQNLRRIRDRNPLPVVEHKIQEEDDDDSDDEQPPAKKQTKTSVAKNPTVAKNPAGTRPHADEKEEKWDLHYRALIQYCIESRDKLPKQKLTFDFEGQKLNLGSWVDVLKQRHRGTGGRTALSEEEKSQLEQLPAWLSGRERVDGEDHWQLMFGLLKEYEKKEGKLPTTRSKDMFQEYPVKEVGIWVQTQKKRFEVKGGLHAFRGTQLERMREVPSWLAFEDKVAKRNAQAAQAAQVAQVAAQEAEAVEPAIQPLALTAMSIFKGNKAKGGSKAKEGGGSKGKGGEVKEGVV